MSNLVKESLNKKFTFKRHIRTGRFRSFEPQHNYDIKLNGLMVGNILETTSFGSSDAEDEGKFTIGFEVNKKDPMEDKNPNCTWKWVKLKRRFDTYEESIQFVKDNTEIILKQFDLHYSEK